MRTKPILFAVATLLACLLPVSGATAQEDRTEKRLLAGSEGLQMPSSESDSAWNLVSYASVGELPDAKTFGEMSGCPPGSTTRYDFDETLAVLGSVEPWMDAGQVRSARGFRQLARLFDREFEKDAAVYRCDTGEPEVEIYFVGAGDDHLSGLMTVSIET